MTHPVKLADLKNMPKGEKGRVLGGLVAGARSETNGRSEELDAEIREYERRYEVSSERMLRELEEGKREETAEIASWIMRLRIRERMARAGHAG